MSSIESKTIPLPVVEQRTTTGDEVVDIRLNDIPSGREVWAVHRRNGDSSDSYSFRVIEDARNACAYRGEDEPPIDVVQAVEQFGYHVRNIGSYPPEYADRQYVTRILNRIEAIWEQSSDPLLQRFLLYSTGWLEHGRTLLTLRATLGDHLGSDAVETLVNETFEQLTDTSEGNFIEVEPGDFQQKLTTVALDQGYLSPQELEDAGVPTENGHISSLESDHQQVVELTVEVTQSDVNGGTKLLVTAFGEEHVDRFIFDVVDTDEHKCVLQKGDSNRRPPAEVFEAVNQTGYTVTNFYVPTQGDARWEQLLKADGLLGEIVKSYEEGRRTQLVLGRGHNAIQGAATVALLREIMEPETYRQRFTQAVYTSPDVRSADELMSSARLAHLTEFLYDHLMTAIDAEKRHEIDELFEETNFF